VRALPLLALAALCACTATSFAGDSATPAPGEAPGGAFKDGLLVAAAKARLAADDFDSATHVHVIVRDGAATLSGSARSGAQRAKDAALVAGVKGITSVDNRLTVAASSGSKSAGDLALAAQVTGAIAAQTGVNALSVKVEALDGRVTVTGTAPTQAVKDTMLAAVRSIAAVRNVDDRIAVRK
jgi:osmotically-inducible protein OsmY